MARMKASESEHQDGTESILDEIYAHSGPISTWLATIPERAWLEDSDGVVRKHLPTRGRRVPKRPAAI